MNNAPDRLIELKQRGTVTGIDFIKVYPDQVNIDIYLHAFNDPNATGPAVKIKDLLNNLTVKDIRIYNIDGDVPDIAVLNLAWTADNILHIMVESRGDFTLYQMLINDRKNPGDPFRIDPFYNDISFDFKINCPSDLDCAPPAHECIDEAPVDFPVDYMARDFWSYRKALLEFASLRYPGWPDRLEADAGVMMAEVMSAVGDEMAYYQDRIGREAFLETATQRRSLRRHASLVDYTLRDGHAASCWLDITVRAGASGNIPAGKNFWALGESGVRTDFETGAGLLDAIKGKTHFVDAARNEFNAYRFDEDQRCLEANATEMYIDGKHAADLLNFAGITPDAKNGKWVLLKTKPDNPAQPARAWMVMLISVKDTIDPVMNVPITYVKWSAAQALPFEMDMTVLVMRANLLPATSGKTQSQYFLTGANIGELGSVPALALQNKADAEGAPIFRAIEREGNDDSITYRCTLEGTEQQPLVRLTNEDTSYAPEMYMTQENFVTPNWLRGSHWNWREKLVGTSSSGAGDDDYTLDDGSWRRIVGYWRNGQELVHEDYATEKGVTIRFGDDLFGKIPPEKTVFHVSYRLGGGSAANVAPNVIRIFDATGFAFIESVTNPLVATGGLDPEKPDEIRQSAPQEFRTITYRAVRPEDYAEAATRLPWVQKAGAQFRWTGSWITAFVTPDPLKAVSVSDLQKHELQEQLNRFRQAGREVHTMDPLYADLDMEICICGSPDVYLGELEERILISLFGKKTFIPIQGFFSPDRFSFGDLLERSVLEASIQAVPGVKAIEKIRFRRRGHFDWRVFSEYYYNPGKNSIIRVENDPLHPERGIVKIKIHGTA